MITQYTHHITVVVPETLMEKANHLACIVGESAADINTFTFCGWQDVDGILYAVASTVVKPVFLEAVNGLPETPPHAVGIANRVLAEEALGTLNSEGGIQMIVGADPHTALGSLGLTPVPFEDEY